VVELLPAVSVACRASQASEPAQNARKRFATVEIERMNSDQDWLDKAIRIVEEKIQKMNWKQGGNQS
jgi:hypothetical protein